MDTNKVVFINVVVWNIGLLILAGLLCFKFNSMWGLMPLLLVKSIESTTEKKGEN